MMVAALLNWPYWPCTAPHLHGVGGLFLQFCIELVDGGPQRSIVFIKGMEPGLPGIDAIEIVLEHRQRILRGQHLGVVRPQRVAAGGDDVRRRVGAGGQLIVQAVAAVRRDPCSVPLGGFAGLGLELCPAEAEERRQQDHHAERNGRSLALQRRRERLFQPGQLLLGGGQAGRSGLRRLCFAVAARVKAAGGSDSNSGKNLRLPF